MKKCVFTLIELLITIAIIAILAAMLMPALNMARERARQSHCLANLKQFGAGFFSYADDNKGFIPYRGNSAQLYTVVDFIASDGNAISEEKAWTMANSVYFYLSPYIKNRNLGACGSVARYDEHPNMYKCYTKKATYCFWSLATQKDMPTRLDDPLAPRMNAALVAYRSPSVIWLMCDRFVDNNIKGVHRNRVNRVYADGHAGTTGATLPNHTMHAIAVPK